MAQTGFTPLALYYSATTTNTPTAANLQSGELAININDGILFYKDSGGAVQQIASKAGNVNVSSISFGTTGLTPSTATTGAVTLAGTLGTTSGGTGLTSFTANAAVYSTSTSALTTGTLPVAAGGTGQTSFTSGQVHYGSFSTSANFTFDGSYISDVAGNVRSVPINSQTSAYVLASSDNGKMVSITTGGVTVNNSIMSAGNIVTIYNNSGSSQTITQGSGVTMTLGGSTTTGNRSLASNGVATVLCTASNTFVITGAGLT